MRQRGLAFILLFALGACLGATLASGVPHTLPGVALESEVIFHAERTVGLFVGLLLVVIVVAKAWQGELPSEISGRGLKYATREIQENTADALASLTEALDEMRERQRRIEDRMEELEG